ncbi:MAG: hypothetical protein WA705_12665, partial [Candidatus Ozemobacteraceae bacterium]
MTAQQAIRDLPKISEVRRCHSSEKPEPVSVPTELPTGYYLDHFRTLLDTVEDRYGDLLCPEERAFLEKFRDLSLPAQRLYVRLISRKGPVFRSDRLSYPEIPDLEGTWFVLADAGFLSINDPAFCEHTLELLTTPELRALAGEGGISIVRTGRKGDVCQAILDNLPGEKLLIALNRRFQWLSPLFLNVLRVFRLFYFGSSEADLSAFILSDLGRIKFESYPLLSTDRLFTHRDEVERALRLRDLGDELNAILEDAGADDPAAEVERLLAILPQAGGHPLLTRWRRRFLEKAARFWERQERADRALELYSDAETFPARERRARLLVRMGKPDEALACCREILTSPRDPEEEEVASNLITRLQSGKPNRSTFPPVVERLVLLPDPPGRIEQRVLEALADRGIQGFEAENRFWTSLFALVFWDILFLPVPRAFGHP